MNKIAKLEEKAPLLQISDWVQGEPTNLDQLIGRVVLIEVFQVNCPGCFWSYPWLFHYWQDRSDEMGKKVFVEHAGEHIEENKWSKRKEHK